MAEIFLSASIHVLFEKLLSPDFINYFSRGEGVHTAVKKWTTMLMKIQAVLTDAEEKQITNRAVKIWLDELRDLAYDVEDILDEFATEALRRNLMAEPQASTSKIQSLIPTCCTSFKPSAVMFNFEMKSKIKEITARLEQIVTQKSQLELRENAGGMSNRARERRETTSLVAESRVVGREKDKEAILEQLFSGEAGADEVCVITIIGMGGVGKTTLAQLVYNDDKVKGNFDMKAWVCVSEEFDLIRVTKGILESFNLQASDLNNLNSLQERLKENLSKKKFLLVLDDVWHENYEDWTILHKPLTAGSPGSKIIVTTRNQGVSQKMSTSPSFHLKELSEDDCLSIFTQHALGTRGFDAHPNLKETGEEIVKRCKGLPLAAKALGGLLRSNIDLDEWKDVLNSTIWGLPEEKCSIIPALRLSYHHLPSHLKQCFAYCSILPKDYEFEEEELILLWMATSLLQRQHESKQMEEIGGRYFRDLLSRSFFQISNINKSTFVMHDLINDLAQWIAGETYFRLEDTLNGQKQCKISKKARHSSYIGSNYDGIEKFKAFNDVKSLRTFVSLMIPSWGKGYLTNYVLLELLPKLQYLRVISLRNYHITELPNSIGDLKHLRYLNLCGTYIICLPKSISTLYNLETLILKNCFRLKKLPTAMENLINLRLLDITDAYLIKELPQRVGKLTNLQKLSNFILGNNGGAGIRELKTLKNLRGTLCISGLENVIDPQDAKEANLKDKQDLNILTMGWSLESTDSRIEEGVEREVLDMLQPHKKLKELTVKCYSGTMLPTWVGDPSFSTLEYLILENCLRCTSLPPIGQLPLLKNLCIKGMDGINIVGLEFYGDGCLTPFRSLETLSFEDMKEWTNWSSFVVDRWDEVFPCLCELSILGCPKLLGNLPDQLPSLEKLIINGCPQLVVSISSLPKLCELDIKECQEMVQRSTNHLDSLKSMVLSNVSEFTCLTEGCLQALTKVEDLTIVGCNELTSLWRKEAGLLQNLTSLRRLEIKDCPKFVSLVAEEVEQQQQGLPCGLESLVLESCDSLEKLQGLNILTSLRALTIKKCREFMSFPETSLPSMLRELRIQNCDALKSLLLMHCNNGDSLEELHIWDCPNLTFLSSRGELPASLKSLSIDECPKLESVAKRPHNNTSSLERIDIRSCESLKSLPEGLHNLIHLSSIQIGWCSSLVSFPDGGLPSTTLRQLRILYCEKLKALPDRMHLLTSLQELEINGCQCIVSFPQEGFPTSLISLDISYLNICKPLFEWGLHRLTSLQDLGIEGECSDLVSFPEEEKGMSLPSSLTNLRIKNFPNLEYLSSKRFQNLTSLKFLSILSCPNLKSFSEVGLPPSLSNGLFQNLTSLAYLWISDCPKLKYFSDEGLPPSLLQLHIRGCPLLKQRYEKGKGRDWPKIAYIPYVEIDGRCRMAQEYEKNGILIERLLIGGSASLEDSHTIGDYLMRKGFQKMTALLDRAIEGNQKLRQGCTNILRILEDMNHHDVEKLIGENVEFLPKENFIINRDDELCIVEKVPKINDDPMLLSTKRSTTILSLEIRAPKFSGSLRVFH